jgi:hypothetical protein
VLTAVTTTCGTAVASCAKAVFMAAHSADKVKVAMAVFMVVPVALACVGAPAASWRHPAG